MGKFIKDCYAGGAVRKGLVSMIYQKRCLEGDLNRLEYLVKWIGEPIYKSVWIKKPYLLPAYSNQIKSYEHKLFMQKKLSFKISYKKDYYLYFLKFDRFS